MLLQRIALVVGAAFALTFGLTFRTLILKTRSIRGSSSALPSCSASAALSMSRPVRECVTRTRRSVMIARESRGARATRTWIRRTKRWTTRWECVTASGTSTGAPCASRPA